jgi:hypothetical protein
MKSTTLGVIIYLMIASPSIAANCQFEASPNVLEQSESHLLQYWDFSNTTLPLSQELPHSDTLSTYRNTVESRISIDPQDILNRHLLVRPDSDDAFNIKMVLASIVAEIRPIRCIEALLLDHQLSRNPRMLTEPTEFLSYFLKHPDGRLRVYYLTDDINGVRKMRGLVTHIASDLKNDWTVVSNLHNHSFFEDFVEPGDKFRLQGGVLAPSANDVKVFLGHKKNLGLQSASITNGFHTVDIRGENFACFRAAKD